MLDHGIEIGQGEVNKLRRQSLEDRWGYIAFKVIVSMDGRSKFVLGAAFWIKGRAHAELRLIPHHRHPAG